MDPSLQWKCLRCGEMPTSDSPNKDGLCGNCWSVGYEDKALALQAVVAQERPQPTETMQVARQAGRERPPTKEEAEAWLQITPGRFTIPDEDFVNQHQLQERQTEHAMQLIEGIRQISRLHRQQQRQMLLQQSQLVQQMEKEQKQQLQEYQQQQKRLGYQQRQLLEQGHQQQHHHHHQSQPTGFEHLVQQNTGYPGSQDTQPQDTGKQPPNMLPQYLGTPNQAPQQQQQQQQPDQSTPKRKRSSDYANLDEDIPDEPFPKKRNADASQVR